VLRLSDWVTTDGKLALAGRGRSRAGWT